MRKRGPLPYRTFAGFIEHQGWTQGDLARVLNLSQAQISRILTGKRRASVDLLYRLSQLSALPMEVLAVELHGKRVA